MARPPDAPRLGALALSGSGLDAPGPAARIRCSDILREGREYAVTFLDAALFRPTFHDRRRAEG